MFGADVRATLKCTTLPLGLWQSAGSLSPCGSLLKAAVAKSCAPNMGRAEDRQVHGRIIIMPGVKWLLRSTIHAIKAIAQSTLCSQSPLGFVDPSETSGPTVGCFAHGRLRSRTD